MSAINKMTDEELKSEYKATDHMIYEVQCYGTRDMQYLFALGAELEKRCIDVQLEPVFYND